MEIQFWADFECPHCFLGNHRLHRAMNILGIKDIKITKRSYLLNPRQDLPDGLPMDQVYKQRYGGETPDILASFDRLEARALTEGLRLDLHGARWAYMMDAHRLLHFAGSRGLGNQFFNRAQRALFQEHRLLSDHAVLLEIAEAVGLPRAEAQDVLKSDAYLKAVLADDAAARALPLDYVPYYILNGKHHFSGDRSLEEYVSFLRKGREDKAES